MFRFIQITTVRTFVCIWTIKSISFNFGNKFTEEFALICLLFRWIYICGIQCCSYRNCIYLHFWLLKVKTFVVYGNDSKLLHLFRNQNEWWPSKLPKIFDFFTNKSLPYKIIRSDIKCLLIYIHKHTIINKICAFLSSLLFHFLVFIFD